MASKPFSQQKARVQVFEPSGSAKAPNQFLVKNQEVSVPICSLESGIPQSCVSPNPRNDANDAKCHQNEKDRVSKLQGELARRISANKEIEFDHLTSVYDRNCNWLKKAESKVQHAQHQKSVENLKECSFRPNLISMNYNEDTSVRKTLLSVFLIEFYRFVQKSLKDCREEIRLVCVCIEERESFTRSNITRQSSSFIMNKRRFWLQRLEHVHCLRKFTVIFVHPKRHKKVQTQKQSLFQQVCNRKDDLSTCFDG